MSYFRATAIVVPSEPLLPLPSGQRQSFDRNTIGSACSSERTRLTLSLKNKEVFTARWFNIDGHNSASETSASYCPYSYTSHCPFTPFIVISHYNEVLTTSITVYCLYNPFASIFLFSSNNLDKISIYTIFQSTSNFIESTSSYFYCRQSNHPTHNNFL